MRMIFGDFFKELDNFIDDATSRKLGGGSTFYGERKSNFSGDNKKSFKEIAEREAGTREVERSRDSGEADVMERLRVAVGLGGSISGAELRALIIGNWGVPFPVVIQKKRDALSNTQLYLVIQWKELGKRNLNLSEEQYVQESDAVASLITEWGCADAVREEIRTSTAVPKLMTQQFPGLFINLDVPERIVETW
jgi:hypothetical protein